MGKLRTKAERIMCAIFGHTKIINICFGQVTCGRCGAITGDTLLGVYNAKNKVVIGHNCPTCRENYKKLKWHDKFLSPNPFTEEE